MGRCAACSGVATDGGFQHGEFQDGDGFGAHGEHLLSESAHVRTWIGHPGGSATEAHLLVLMPVRPVIQRGDTDGGLFAAPEAERCHAPEEIVRTLWRLEAELRRLAQRDPAVLTGEREDLEA